MASGWLLVVDGQWISYLASGGWGLKERDSEEEKQRDGEEERESCMVIFYYFYWVIYILF